jgi:hypothetical protein
MGRKAAKVAKTKVGAPVDSLSADLPRRTCPSSSPSLSSSHASNYSRAHAEPFLIQTWSGESASGPSRTQAGEAKRTKLYGKYGKLIVTAVKQGGGADPVSNMQLAKVLGDASRLSVPRELIERNIKRATDTTQLDFMELTYEVG